MEKDISCYAFNKLGAAGYTKSYIPLYLFQDRMFGMQEKLYHVIRAAIQEV